MVDYASLNDIKVHQQQVKGGQDIDPKPISTIVSKIFPSLLAIGSSSD